MAARAGIAWISTNLLDVQRVRPVHTHLSLSGEGQASFLGVVTTGCSPLPEGGHVRVALAGAPRFILLHQERPEPAHGLIADALFIGLPLVMTVWRNASAKIGVAA